MSKEVDLIMPFDLVTNVELYALIPEDVIRKLEHSLICTQSQVC